MYFRNVLFEIICRLPYCILATLVVSCGQSKKNDLCQPPGYYQTPDTVSVPTPVVFGEIVEGYIDPIVDTLNLDTDSVNHIDSMRFDSLMKVN